MSAKPRRPERPVASIEELILAVRRESAAALSTAEEFLPDAASRQAVRLPRQFPLPARPPDDPQEGPRDLQAPPGREPRQ